MVRGNEDVVGGNEDITGRGNEADVRAVPPGREPVVEVNDGVLSNTDDEGSLKDAALGLLNVLVAEDSGLKADRAWPSVV